MGLFTKNNEDDFLSQQMREEGTFTEFESASQSEIKHCIDNGHMIDDPVDSDCTTHTLDEENKAYQPVSQVVKELQDAMQRTANKLNQNNQNTQDFQSNYTQNTTQEPEYRKYRSTEMKKTTNIDKAGGLYTAGIVLFLLGFFGIPLASFAGMGLLIYAVLKNKGMRK